MRIGILGSGLMGGKLGTLFARAGHEVTFSYARSEEKLKTLAREAKARYGTPAEAAKDADAVLLAVHWLRFDDVLKQAGELAGKVVITCSLPMNEDDAALAVGTTSSGAEELAKKLPRARIAAAFNTVPSEAFFPVHGSKPESRPHIVYYGDDERAKEVAAQLIREIGFEPLDAGPLRVARYAEPFALLVAQLAYEGAEGPELAYRFERF
jgi:predicted dinucleotide-binding enzyme